MKSYRPFLYLLALLVSVGALACADTDRYDAEQQLEADVSEVRSAIASGLERADRRIDALGSRVDSSAAQASDEMAASWRETVAELRDQREAIARSLEGLSMETRSAFAQSQLELNEQMRALNARITEARLETIAARDEFEAAVASELASIDRRIDSLDTDIRQWDDPAAAQYRDTLDRLQRQRQELAHDWEAFEDASTDELAEKRASITSLIAQLDRELSEATDEIRTTIEA